MFDYKIIETLQVMILITKRIMTVFLIMIAWRPFIETNLIGYKRNYQKETLTVKTGFKQP